ncbi:MAG TPA: long-chain-fatty-acid--CoA ligase, partial [Salinisphaeraceae bacterium]|nr:long-chain-fatty-acid--CoA ligase [Salinisphaeraceae bacterium]
IRLPADDIAWIMRHAKDRFLIIDDVLLPLLDKFADQVDLDKIIVVPLAGQALPANMINYEDFLADDRHFEYPAKQETDPCGMCYSSGTTGRPKGVVYSHRSTWLHALGAALPDGLGLSYNDCVLPVVPMFHVNAWGTPYAATMVGAKQVHPGPHLDAINLLDLCAQENVTMAAGVPTIWMGILEALNAEPERWALQSMRMVVGGSAAPPWMFTAFDKHGLTVVHAWGMTETSPLASVAQLRPHIRQRSAEEQLAIRATVGIAPPLVDMRIADDDNRELPWNGADMGEIQVRGPWITGAYFGGQGADKFTADGWLRTGDIATMDADGYVNITDRTKDVIKSGGEWISSVQLENLIMGHAAVAEAAVIAKADDKWGERPLAAIVLKSGQHASGDDINEFLRDKLPKWMLPDDYVFVDAIPLTATGKFSKLQLRRQLFGE